MNSTQAQLNNPNTEMVQVNILIPEILWRKAKILAIDRRRSAASVWIEAMTEYLERQTA